MRGGQHRATSTPTNDRDTVRRDTALPRSHKLYPDDTSLRDAALRGEPPALRSLTELLLPVVRSRVARVLARYRGQAAGRDLAADLDDLSQEAFARLFASRGKALRSWEGARGLSLRNYVGLLAEQSTLQVLRSRRQNPWTDEPKAPEDLPARLASDNPEARVGASLQLARLLDRLRAELSPKALQVFELLVVQRLEVQEVCDHTGMSRDAVYAWRSRITKRVQVIREEMSSLAPPAHTPSRGGAHVG